MKKRRKSQAKIEYANKLKDPRWQRRRLEVMSRADFKCEECSNDRMELHIHHLRYQGDPWEARDEDLRCLCSSCHGKKHPDKVNKKKRGPVTELEIGGLPSLEENLIRSLENEPDVFPCGLFPEYFLEDNCRSRFISLRSNPGRSTGVLGSELLRESIAKIIRRGLRIESQQLTRAIAEAERAGRKDDLKGLIRRKAYVNKHMYPPKP